MKFFKFGFLFVLTLELLSIQCFGMEGHNRPGGIANPNPLVTAILDQIRAKAAAQILNPEEFWGFMEASAEMGSCFLGEFIANSNEEDICLIFDFLVKFGNRNKKQFYKCMTTCLGIDGVTPLNELIRRMPLEYNPGSKLISIFFQLLDLISIFDPQKKNFLLQQRDLYGMEKIGKRSERSTHGTFPALTANISGKIYISQAISQIVEPKDPPHAATPDSDSSGSLGSPETIRTHGPTIVKPEVHRWDGRRFLSPDFKLS